MYEDYIKYCETENQTNVLNCVNECGGNMSSAARKLGVHPSCVSRTLDRVKKNARLRAYDPEHNLDRPLSEGMINAGTSELVDMRTGKQVLKWFKSKPTAEQKTEAILERLEHFKYKPAPIIKAPPKKQKKDLLSLYTITDFHLGMYSCVSETGGEWNTEIASEVMLNAINEMAEESPDAHTAILNIQGDFLHWDGLDPVTPSHGHILDAATRFDQMIDISLDLVQWSIEILLKKHAEVKLIVCEGNHDLGGSAWIRKCMKRLWRKNKRVEIDDTAFPFYAHLHGETMLAIHHGHKVTNKSLPQLFASEPRYREMWGKAKCCYIHTGHYHKIERNDGEFGGAVVERHPTLSARDAYAARGGFVSDRGAHVITYSLYEGEKTRYTVRPKRNNQLLKAGN